MTSDGSNGFDTESIAKFLSEIDAADDVLLGLKSDFMISCKGPRAKIRAAMKTAKTSGLNMAAFTLLVRKHREERKIEQRLAELEADERIDFESMQRALGDYGSTPLGAAALDKAKAAETALDDLGA